MPENPDMPPPVEALAVDGAHAPYLYFDNAPTFGHYERVVVAHLRMSVPTAAALRAAVDGALLMASPAAGPPSGKAN